MELDLVMRTVVAVVALGLFALGMRLIWRGVSRVGRTLPPRWRVPGLMAVVAIVGAWLWLTMPLYVATYHATQAMLRR